MSLTTSRPSGNDLTLADLEALPEIPGHRYELVAGVIIVTPAPSRAHQRASLALAVILRSACPPSHEVLAAPFDADITPDQRVEPDLLVLPVDPRYAKRLVGPGLLFVEIVSPRREALDLGLKFDAYEAAGVPFYWVVDPIAEVVHCFELIDGAYRAYGEGPVVAVDRPVRCTIDVPKLVAPPA